MDYYNISLNNIYLILSFNNKTKTTFIIFTHLSITNVEFIFFYYLLIKLIIYLIKKNLLKFKKNSLNLNFVIKMNFIIIIFFK